VTQPTPSYQQGATANFNAQFSQYAGGAPIDVTGLQWTIYSYAQASNVNGPTNVGITHPATGLYTTSYVIPPNLPVGQYAIIWTANEANTFENFNVITAAQATNDTRDPCGWGNPVWTCDITSFSPTVTGQAAAAAAEILNGLTGYQFGACQMTIRPCRRSCWDATWPFNYSAWWQFGYWPRPLFYNGVWYNLTCGGCLGDCSCTIISEALLPAPVNTIIEVKVDGVALTPNVDYRLDNYRRLVKLGTGKNAEWPLCNDLSLDDSQVGTWSVTLTVGNPLPMIGSIAYGELASQLAKLIACDESCTLPKPVQQIVRQGVTLNFLDPNEIFANGRIGLYLCDLFITTYNPNKLMNAAAVYDVDATDGQTYRITG